MIFFNEIYVVLIIFLSIIFWNFVKESYRTKFIIVNSFIGLAFIQLKFSIFLALLVLFVFWGCKVIEKDVKFKWFLTLLIILISILMIFKYIGVLIGLIFLENNDFSKSYLIPLGISYLSFKLIAFVIDVYRGHIKNPSLEKLLALVFFLPIFPAGPIERYQDFAKNQEKEFNWSSYSSGLQRIVIGYFKKVVIVNFLLNEIVTKRLYPIIMENGISFNLSSLLIISYLVGYLFYAYFDISGYADIAIGFGKLFGYKICEDMNYPIFQKNLSDYWFCWHMSLSSWCRNNIYFPVLGWTRRNNLALYCSFIVMGLWHFISIKWFLWGLWHATGIIIFKKWDKYKRKNKKLKKLFPKKLAYSIGVILTILYSGLGFSFITMANAPDALKLLLSIFL